MQLVRAAEYPHVRTENVDLMRKSLGGVHFLSENSITLIMAAGEMQDHLEL